MKEPIQQPEPIRASAPRRPSWLIRNVRQRNRKNVALIAVVLLVAGCSEPEHVSVAEFKKAYAEVGQPQSMRYVAFLGLRDGRAFIKISSMPVIGSKWKERVVYVELGELDDALRQALKKEPNQTPEPTAPSGRGSP